MIKSVILNKPYDLKVTIPLDHEGKHELKGIFKHQSSGKIMKIPGFEYSKNEGRIRFSLPIEGAWEYSIHTNFHYDNQYKIRSIFCEETKDSRFPIEISNSQVRPIFSMRDNPFFKNAYECNWLFALWMKDENCAKKFLDKLKNFNFNSINFNVYAHECAWSQKDTPGRLVPPPLFNWGGTNQDPDFSVINQTFYQKFDGLMNYLYQQDLIAHIYLYVWNKGNNYPEPESQEDITYITHFISRYQAYPNIIWDYSKETYLRIDKERIRRSLHLIRKIDAYKRLLTVHDDKLIQYDKTFDHLLDFYSMQIHHDYYSKTLREVEKCNKPVFVIEYNYEAGKNLQDKTYGEAHTYEDFMKVSWELAIAGTPLCYYYTFTAWDVIRTEDTPKGYEGSKRIAEFFNSFDWWKYSASPEINRSVRTITACAKHIDKEAYVLMTNHHGIFGFICDIKRYTIIGEWIDMFSGEITKMREEDLTHIYNSEIGFAICPFGKKYGDYSFYIARFELTEIANDET